MAYFANGTEGEIYQERYCNHCIHDINEDCPILLLHLVYNRDSSMEGVLNHLIPREGVTNLKCRMYIESNPIPIDGEHITEVERLGIETKKLIEWNEKASSWSNT